MIELSSIYSLVLRYINPENCIRSHCNQSNLVNENTFFTEDAGYVIIILSPKSVCRSFIYQVARYKAQISFPKIFLNQYIEEEA